MAKVVLWTIVNSACNLHDVRFLGDMKVYTEISLSNDPYTTKKTPVDTKGLTNPSWNFKTNFIFDASLLQDQTLELIFDLKCQRTFGDKSVGKVRIPVQELLKGAVGHPLGSIQLVTYPVKGRFGLNLGTLTFSYSFAKASTATSTGNPGRSTGQQPQLNNYAQRLQELGIAVSAASLAEKLYRAAPADNLPSGETGEALNIYSSEIDPSSLGLEGLTGDVPTVDVSGAVDGEASSSIVEFLLGLLSS